MELPSGEVVLSVQEVMSTKRTIEELMQMMTKEPDVLRRSVLRGGVEYNLKHLRYVGAQTVANLCERQYEEVVRRYR